MRYGRATLPALIDATDQYDTWEELIPAVFGVPAVEFQAGWQAYLASDVEQHVLSTREPSELPQTQAHNGAVP